MQTAAVQEGGKTEHSATPIYTFYHQDGATMYQADMTVSAVSHCAVYMLARPVTQQPAAMD